jgi:hypothetical protein
MCEASGVEYTDIQAAGWLDWGSGGSGASVDEPCIHLYVDTDEEHWQQTFKLKCICEIRNY